MYENNNKNIYVCIYIYNIFFFFFKKKNIKYNNITNIIIYII